MNKEIFYTSCKNGEFDLLKKWSNEKLITCFDDKSVEYLCVGNHLEILEWVEDNVEFEIDFEMDEQNFSPKIINWLNDWFEISTRACRIY